MGRALKRFGREATLLVTRQLNGVDAVALDTGNVFTFVKDIGWVQQNRPEDQQLVPTDGQPGQVLEVMPADDPAWTGFRARADANTVPYPVSFADGQVHQLGVFTIRGGRLGPNGYFRVTVSGHFLTASSGNNSLSITVASDPPGYGLTLSGDQVLTSSERYHWRYEWLGLNRGNETGGQVALSEMRMRAPNGNLYNSILSGDAGSVDTSKDWTLLVSIQAGQPFAEATAELCLGEAYYVP